MKILYVENMIFGHHVPYVQALAGYQGHESVVITPQRISSISQKQFVFPKMSFDSKRLSDYCECLRYIDKIAREEGADIIHFLDGDKIMRYFGLGIKGLSQRHAVVITYHHLFEGIVRRISYTMMCRHSAAVVHTARIQSVLKGYGIRSVTHIEYPSFLKLPARENLQNDGVPVIGMFGGMRYEKGLDILIEALEKVRHPYRLLIAGREDDYTRNDVERMCAKIGANVTLDSRFLTEAELARYWNETDLVVLPYRASFDGASGQLTEGVSRRLPIIGPEHGSLGSIIRENHLGMTFRTEDSDDLALKIEAILQDGFVYDSVARDYQEAMSPERFCRDYQRLYMSLI